jgi:hypothetical protein
MEDADKNSKSLVLITTCGFDPHHRHHRRTLIGIPSGFFFFAPSRLKKYLQQRAFRLLAHKYKIKKPRQSDLSGLFVLLGRMAAASHLVMV